MLAKSIEIAGTRGKEHDCSGSDKMAAGPKGSGDRFAAALQSASDPRAKAGDVEPAAALLSRMRGEGFEADVSAAGQGWDRLPYVEPPKGLSVHSEAWDSVATPNGGPVDSSLAPVLGRVEGGLAPNLCPDSAAQVAAARQIFSWAARSIVAAVADRKGARLRVFSQKLGPISLSVRVRAMAVSVDFDTSEKVSGLLLREASALADDLDSHGVRLLRFSVRLPGGLRRAILPR